MALSDDPTIKATPGGILAAQQNRQQSYLSGALGGALAGPVGGALAGGLAYGTPTGAGLPSQAGLNTAANATNPNGMLPYHPATIGQPLPSNAILPSANDRALAAGMNRNPVATAMAPTAGASTTPAAGVGVGNPDFLDAAFTPAGNRGMAEAMRSPGYQFRENQIAATRQEQRAFASQAASNDARYNNAEAYERQLGTPGGRYNIANSAAQASQPQMTPYLPSIPAAMSPTDIGNNTMQAAGAVRREAGLDSGFGHVAPTFQQRVAAAGYDKPGGPNYQPGFNAGQAYMQQALGARDAAMKGDVSATARLDPGVWDGGKKLSPEAAKALHDSIRARELTEKPVYAPMAERSLRVRANANGNPISAAMAHFQAETNAGRPPQDAASWANAFGPQSAGFSPQLAQQNTLSHAMGLAMQHGSQIDPATAMDMISSAMTGGRKTTAASDNAVPVEEPGAIWGNAWRNQLSGIRNIDLNPADPSVTGPHGEKVFLGPGGQAYYEELQVAGGKTTRKMVRMPPVPQAAPGNGAAIGPNGHIKM